MKVFIWFLFFLPIVYAAENYDHFENYDYFQLVQYWPPTFCGGTAQLECAPEGTLPHPLMNFTIDGFWPSDSTTPEPPRNCSGPPFNEYKIEPLKDDLKTYWSNLTQVWNCSWNIHGKCSADRFTEFGYFSLALELKKHIDIHRILSDGHINPSPTALYRSSNISDLIKNKTGRIPRLWCKDDEHPSPLLEISICYDLALAYMDCPQPLLDNPRNGCDEIVPYPKYPCKIPDNGTDKKDEL
ncbi:hypothetical protein CMV_016951 [Castanea mollissima]|uniref:Uncharacterized protein n=1 Tax=Castanea mollissima TaxID=60419 RepID=A0A8J4QRR9_9ROSI|nr:hypothetical protein CMV_016951 [Castanea mollissima]